MTSLDILVVDHKYAKVICREMKRFLKDNDIKYHATADENNAIDLVKHRSFDLIVLDYDMPLKNGFQLAGELRGIKKDIKIAGFSAYWNEKEAEEVGLVLYSSSLQPITDYISKNLLFESSE